MRSLCALLGHVTLMVACTGCFTHRPVNELRADAPVLVEFNRATTVAAVAAPGDSLWLRDVTKLRGRLERITRDTAYVHVTETSTTARVNQRIQPGRVVTIERQPGVFIEGREFKPLRTAGLIVGIAALLAAAGIVVWIAGYGAGE